MPEKAKSPHFVLVGPDVLTRKSLTPEKQILITHYNTLSHTITLTEVTKCDLKQRAAFEVNTFCIYRVRCSAAFQLPPILAFLNAEC
jgi:hypothetical protein